MLLTKNQICSLSTVKDHCLVKIIQDPIITPVSTIAFDTMDARADPLADAEPGLAKGGAADVGLLDHGQHL